MSERNFETLEAGAIYETRGGDRVKIAGEGLNKWWLGQYSSGEDGKWRANGIWCCDGSESARDLIRKIEPKRVVWVNAFEGDTFSIHTELEAAKAYTTARRTYQSSPHIARIRVEYTPGQFDS